MGAPGFFVSLASRSDGVASYRRGGLHVQPLSESASLQGRNSPEEQLRALVKGDQLLTRRTFIVSIRH